jgi:uncharacterized protein (TIGR03067 family)
MRTLLLTAGLLAGSAAVVNAEGKGAPTDQEKIQGTWTFVSGESDGKAVPPEKIKDSTVVIGKDTILVRDGNNKKTWEVGYRLDPTKSPRAITMQLTEGDQKGRKTDGIYQLEGDSLKLCYALPGGARPSGFTTRAGGKTNCFTLKRAK